MRERALDRDGPGEEVRAVEQEGELIDQSDECLDVVLAVDAPQEPRAQEQMPPTPARAVDRGEPEADARLEDRFAQRERKVALGRRPAGAAREREGGLSPWPHAEDRLDVEIARDQGLPFGEDDRGAREPAHADELREEASGALDHAELR